MRSGTVCLVVQRARHGSGASCSTAISADVTCTDGGYAIASYNGTPHGGLNNVTPLEAIGYFVPGKQTLVTWLPESPPLLRPSGLRRVVHCCVHHSFGGHQSSQTQRRKLRGNEDTLRGRGVFALWGIDAGGSLDGRTSARTRNARSFTVGRQSRARG
jgi:hypothetical protein